MTTQSYSPKLPDVLSLVGKKVLVTGAANGIGRATAHAAAELGATLLLTDRAALADIKTELEETGASVDTLEGDLTDEGIVDQLIAKGTNLRSCSLCWHSWASATA